MLTYLREFIRRSRRSVNQAVDILDLVLASHLVLLVVLVVDGANHLC
jgi:hypothetical protein